MTRDTGFPADVVEKIWDRDRGACARCGRGLNGDLRGSMLSDGWAVHHREPRARLGIKGRPWVNLAANGILLCNGCHEEVESHRRLSLALGYLVSALRVFRPSLVPIRHAAHGWVTLDNDGGWSPVDEFAGAMP